MRLATCSRATAPRISAATRPLSPPGRIAAAPLPEISEIDAAAYEQVRQALARHFLDELGAPSAEIAAAAAEDECAYTADLAGGFPSEVWITVRREPTEDGVGERYMVFKRLMIGTHKL